MNIEIANRLYEYRKANGYSQEELAEKIGVSRQAISKWERSESSPDTDNLIALAKLYNVSLDEMINGATAPVKAEDAPVKEEPAVEPQPQYAAPAYTAPTYYDNAYQNYSEQSVTQTVQQEPEKKKAPWISALVWLVGLVLFLLVGAVFPSGWRVSWIIILLIPAVDSGIDAVLQNKPQKFAYPLLVTALFCALGMGFGLWHPAWILFVTIPVYYIIADNINKPEQPAEKRSPVFVTFAVIFAIVIFSTFGMVCNSAAHGTGNNKSPIGEIINYDNSDAYIIGGAALPSQDINSIEVDWVNGSVTVNPAESNEITFSESQPKNEDLTLRYLVENGTLKIQFCKSHISIKSLKDCNKDLIITVPAKAFNELQFDTVSAEINVNSTDAANLEIDSVSGLITATGSYSVVNIDNVSGDALINNTSLKSSIDIDTVSGNFKVNLPRETEGFTASYDSVSGSADCKAFDAVKDTKGKLISYGNSDGINIQFDSVSGNLLINAIENE